MAKTTEVYNTVSRRTALASVAMGLVGMPSQGAASTALAPTSLGKELLRRLAPYYATFEGESMDAAYDRCAEIIDMICERPITTLSDLVDRAIVARLHYQEDPLGIVAHLLRDVPNPAAK
jgi:hypothetical protein